jgi:hypothetical protein
MGHERNVLEAGVGYRSGYLQSMDSTTLIMPHLSGSKRCRYISVNLGRTFSKLWHLKVSKKYDPPVLAWCTGRPSKVALPRRSFADLAYCLQCWSGLFGTVRTLTW